MEICPKCKSVELNEIKIGASCLCDKDFCQGQRCGADEIVVKYGCKECNEEFYSQDYNHYVASHCS